MIQQKNKVIIISCCTILIILFGLLFTFFGSFMFQINTNAQKYLSNVQEIANNQLLFNKWILMIFIFNMLIVAGYFTMYLQVNKINTEVGIPGNAGDEGIQGKDVKGCC